MAVRLNLLLCVALLLIVGCGEPYRSKRTEARDFIEESIPIGTDRTGVLRVLRVSDIGFRQIPAAECEGFVRDPRFKYAGGSAILVTHETNLWSWSSPFHRPSLHSFLAFDADEKLADYTIFLDGGD